jgi:hypothetical protein
MQLSCAKGGARRGAAELSAAREWREVRTEPRVSALVLASPCWPTQPRLFCSLSILLRKATLWTGPERFRLRPTAGGWFVCVPSQHTHSHYALNPTPLRIPIAGIKILLPAECALSSSRCKFLSLHPRKERKLKKKIINCPDGVGWKTAILTIARWRGPLLGCDRVR